MPNKRRREKRKTKARKDRQAAARRLERLRENAMNFEGISAPRALRMSPEALERTVRLGRRRRMVTPFDGIALALGAATMLTPTPRR